MTYRAKCLVDGVEKYKAEYDNYKDAANHAGVFMREMTATKGSQFQPRIFPRDCWEDRAMGITVVITPVLF